MKKLLFIYNPVSGKKTIANNLAKLLSIFQESGYEVTIHETQAKGDACTKLKELEPGVYDRVVVAGGDGTLHEGVEGLRGKDIPLGYVPSGSTNDFAASLGIQGTLEEMAHIAMSDRMTVCDVGRLENESFVYVAAFGTLSDVSYSAPQGMKNVIGHGAYILQGFRSFEGIETIHMKVEYDDTTVEGDFCYGMITNSRQIAGVRMNYAKDVSLDDGKFEVTLIRRPHNPLEVGMVAKDMIIPSMDPEMLVQFQTSRVRFISDEPVAWDLDGEFGGSYQETEVSVDHQAVTIVHGEVVEKEIVKAFENLMPSSPFSQS